VPFLTVKDHFLTKEDFRLGKCTNCGLLFTVNRPDVNVIGNYYKSTDYVSHSSTKKGIVNRVYGLVRNYTLGKKVKLISELVAGTNLLDIGAGTGHFLARAKDEGFTVLGLEPDEDARKVAKELNTVDLLPLSELSSLGQERFDAITMWHVLEHVFELNTELESIIGALKKDGVLVIAVPNYTSFDAKYYKEYWAAYDVPRHLYHFAPEVIIKLVENKGLKFEKMLPMKFDSYYVSMLSEKYKGGSLLNAFRIGLLSNMKAKNGNYSSQIYIFRK
jgi:2-polyprenyl-3-methyl-5-hydroxy-6-metoxy-1,4-benzoquinol methylase